MKNIKEVLIRNHWITLLIITKIIFYYILIDISPISGMVGIITLFIIYSVFYSCYISKFKYSHLIFIAFYIFVTLLMFVDAIYFSYFNQLTSINQLFQMNNLIVVNDSVKFATPPISIFLFFDIPLVYKLFTMARKKHDLVVNIKYRVVNTFMLSIVFAALIIATVNPIKANALIKVNHTEFFTYHFKDVFVNMLSNSTNDKGKPIHEIIASIKDDSNVIEKKRFKGIAKGRNLIVIQLESVQNFVINREYNGQVITPNLNKLIKENSFYFDHYFQNIGKGNTSDAEFASNNSLYPVIKGESYRLYEQNKFKGLPWKLREKGYKTLALHGYQGQFWNRENAYPNQGFEDFLSMEDLDITEKVGFGLSDKEMFKQAADVLAKEYKDKQFYNFIITLSNHYPYLLPDNLKSLEIKDEDKGTVFGYYIQSVRYTDEAIGQFINDLKEKGLYDNSMIVLYGDHHGLNCKDEEIAKQMSQYLGYEYNYDQMLRIPLIIHIPLMNDSKTINTVGGQVDLYPTIANLMDLEIEQPFIFGNDILNVKEGFVASVTYMLEGSFIKDGVIFEMARDGIFENSKAWDIDTREPLSLDGLKEYYEKAVQLVETSKYTLDNNLLNNYSLK